MPDISIDISFRRKELDLSAKFELNKSQVTVILGASGSGKSTLLRLLAGLETPATGNITSYGKTWFDANKNINLAPQQRTIGFVFQDYALFENMTVDQNIGFAVNKSERSKTVDDLLLKLDLTLYKDKYPSQLSGGQKQRVALGRALAIKPGLLLLDEPLSAIDFSLRKQLQKELKMYIKAIDCPVILVTHDLTEAKLMADNLIVMSDGKTVRQGSVERVFSNPVNRSTANAVGWQNFIPVTYTSESHVVTNWGKLLINTQLVPNVKWVSIRPEKIRFGHVKQNSLAATIAEVYDFGIYKEFRCQVDDSLEIVVHRPADEPSPPVHSIVNIHLSSNFLTLINTSKKVPACFDNKKLRSPDEEMCLKSFGI